MKRLIITADDFGMNPIFDGEIIMLAEKGYISAISCMMNRGLIHRKEVAMQLVDAIKDQNIGIGLHLDFDDNVTDFTKETYNQLGTFKDVFQKTPHHIDIHKNPPADEAMKNIVDLCDNLDIPLRNRGDGFLAKKHTQGVRYVASRKTSDEVRSRLSSIAENESSEIVFHPGKYDPNSASTLNREREDDVKMIEFINDILHDMGIHRISTQDLYAI